MTNPKNKKSFWIKARSVVTLMFFLTPLVIFSVYFLVKHDFLSSDIAYSCILAPYAVIVLVGSYLTAYMVKHLPKQSAIPSNKTTDGSIPDKSAPSAVMKPKKPIFERYDTYITCPGCGSLVPKGTKQCECGYDLSGPAVRLGRLLRRAVPTLLCIVLIIVGTVLGYYAGQKSIESELVNQFNLGYESGHSTGYNDGYKIGNQVGYDAGYSAAKKDYSIPNLFSNSFDPTMPRVSGGKSSSIEMPRASGGKLVPIE